MKGLLIQDRIGLLEKNNASEDSLFDWEIEEARKREEYKTLYGEAPAPAGDYDDPFNPAPAESFEPKEAGGEKGDDSRRSGPFRQLGRYAANINYYNIITGLIFLSKKQIKFSFY